MRHIISYRSHRWTSSPTLASLETSKWDNFLVLLGGKEAVSPHRRNEVPISDPVGISENISCITSPPWYSSPHTNLYEATSIKASATAKITGDVDGGVIECKLCSTVELSSWQCFRRHCDTSEDHPVKLTFCNRCGNYFGRQDSKRRHKRTRKYQEEWRTTPRE